MRVLVVEDDPTLADLVARALREDRYAVDTVATVAAASEAVAVNDYDVVVLDLGLPDGDGLDICRVVRRERRDSRVIVLTARDTVDDKVAGLDEGADDYIVKPFDVPELLARVRAVLRRPASAGPTVLEVGDVRLDPAAHRVWRAGVLIPLTAREFAVLHHLLARPGQVVRRVDILEHVWDNNYDGLSNVVDVHVASLRRKLSLPDQPAPIDTVRGVGYVYRADDPA